MLQRLIRGNNASSLLPTKIKESSLGNTMKKYLAILSVVVILFTVSMLAACAPSSDEATVAGESQEDVANVDAWSPDSSCETCHIDQAESMTNSACLVSFHPDNKCTDCHAVDDTLTSVHEGVVPGDKVPKGLKETKVDESQCESCHSLEDIAAATEDLEVLTDANQTVVNPHAIPDVADHAEIQCSDCHAMHEEGGLELTDNNAKRLCGSCHHANVYECHTCHE